MSMGTYPQVTSIRLEKICVARDNGAGSCRELLRDVSFSARCGEITAVIGPSGGGKSTLIRLINRLMDPSSGAVYLEESDVTGIDPLSLRRRVALVPQKPFMFQGTVLENLQRSFAYLRQRPPGPDSERVRHALAAARLDLDFLDRDARSLSLGEQQRVSLARALITSPRVLLLDEPTSALDRRTAEQLGAVFREIATTRLVCVVLVTHDLLLAERIADHCLYLEAGRIIEKGSTGELLARPKTAQLVRFLAEPPAREV